MSAMHSAMTGFATTGLSARRANGCARVSSARRMTTNARRAAATTTTTTTRCASAKDLEGKPNSEVRVLVVGATGYIGKFVTRELCARGYDVTAFTREKSGIGGKTGKDEAKALFPDAKVKFGSVMDPMSIAADAFGEEGYDVVVSCLASRTGGVKDSWDIDYQATKNVLDVARKRGAKHFVLLSAICVQKPTLTFQKAKLKFEADLQAAGDISYSIVRPTAFFKSLAGQVEVVQKGGPYVMFGDGQLASCKPISERDLAKFMADSIREPEMMNKVLPIGGPGEALSALQQGNMLFELLDMEPKFVKVPIEIMDGVIKVLDFFAGFFSNMKDAAEFGKIGRYYAAESMLVMNDKGEYDANATPSYGSDTLKDFFARVAKEGLAGQELGDQAVFKSK